MFVLRDLSLILLMLIGALAALAPLILFGLANYGLIKFRWWQAIPNGFAVVGQYLAIGQRAVERICAAIVAPVLIIGQKKAALSGMARALLEGRR